ncbi:MAG: inorganic phosphate transporter [Rikenellaceae bacterium]
METIYLGIIVFLCLLAILDLWVGVSNDAVNFLNSAVGARSFSYRTIVVIAAIGVFFGAATSNGMMEITRNGIYHPQYFFFSELMCIMLAVMVTDVILLDIFNSLGMPTSTTVSMVFELIGGTVAVALYKSMGSDAIASFSEMINASKAFEIIIGIFLSVMVSFTFGAIVQWLTRLMFTFNYNKTLKWFAGVFGGLAATAIVYFMLIKGIKSISFIPKDTYQMLQEESGMILLYCFVVLSVIMQILHWFKVNIFKVIVLLGTFALAMAFAGNDLVNFVGVPLAGLSSYQDYIANGTAMGVDGYLMTSLNSPAKTPLIYLFIAGGIMVFSLMKSKKAQNVIKTSLSLSRQDEGEEIFGSSAVARRIVRFSKVTAQSVDKVTPKGVKGWVAKRFDNSEAILIDGASFDLVRASINLVIAAVLVAIGTSFKLPLSTTYVTFMVAMGTSLADKAWGRESAVFRITGVIAVIGGWFITGAAAFILCFVFASLMYFGGTLVMVLCALLAIYILFKGGTKMKKNNKDSLDVKDDEIYSKMIESTDKAEIWTLLTQHIDDSIIRTLEHSSQNCLKLTESFITEDIKGLNKAISSINKERNFYKKLKRRQLQGLRRSDIETTVTHNTWFHAITNNSSQLTSSLKRMGEPFKEHADNNFNPLSKECTQEFIPVRNRLVALMQRSKTMIEKQEFTLLDALSADIDALRLDINKITDVHAKRIQDSQTSENINVYLVYMNTLHESQQVATNLKQLIIALIRFHR